MERLDELWKQVLISIAILANSRCYLHAKPLYDFVYWPILKSCQTKLDWVAINEKHLAITFMHLVFSAKERGCIPKHARNTHSIVDTGNIQHWGVPVLLLLLCWEDWLLVHPPPYKEKKEMLWNCELYLAGQYNFKIQYKINKKVSNIPLL